MLACDVSHFNLVKEILIRKWNEYSLPLHANEEDLTLGMTIFTKIAIDAIGKESAAQESSSAASSSCMFDDYEFSSEIPQLEPTPQLGTVDKIKRFVEDNALGLRDVFRIGFPFSLVKSPVVEKALKNTLESSGSILSHLLTLEDHWMDERELDERFGLLLQRLQFQEIKLACCDFGWAYSVGKDRKAGYYLLWMIKQAAGCVYEIPNQGSFNETTVSKVLSEFFENSGSLTNFSHFAELLYQQRSRAFRPFYETLLEPKLHPSFLNFLLKQLVNISIDQWPSKEAVLFPLLEMVTPSSRLAITKALTSSKDLKTSEIGHHLLQGLVANSFREAIPHFYALRDLLPHASETYIETIFARPFVQFSLTKPSDEPGFTKQLCFNQRKEVFIHGSLMIGVYKTGPKYTNVKIPSYLLAFDMNTEKMVWGIPLVPSLPDEPFSSAALIKDHSTAYILKQEKNLLSLQFVGYKHLYLIQPETGEFDSIIELPHAPQNPVNSVHISQDGFAYQVIQQESSCILKGGKIVDKLWNISFTSMVSSGIFRNLSTHCGIQDHLKNRLILVGPAGVINVIEGCIAAEVYEDKLYTVENNPANKEQALLTIRTLKVDDQVISEIEKQIPLNIQHPFFGKLCQNGELILFSRNVAQISPIFVDVVKGEVKYSPHRFSSKSYVINSRSGELWTWGEIEREVWKVSSSEVKLMGPMNTGRGTNLVHVDLTDRLYFVSLPY